MVHVEYGWRDAEATCAHGYILPRVVREIQEHFHNEPITILDLGCGNGYVAGQLVSRGHAVIAVDSSKEGITIAREEYPSVQFHVGSIYDGALIDTVGTMVDCVISLEVVEHLFSPKRLFEQSYRVLKPGGLLILSTPYHGYSKNLAISLTNGWDHHLRVDWDGGHIKFFSKTTLARMACNAGFTKPAFHGVGRFPWLWKSMIMVVEK